MPAVSRNQNKANFARPKKDPHPKPKKDPHPKSFSRNTKCGICIGDCLHQGNCPVQGKSCHKCGKLIYVSKVCRSKSRSNRKPSTNKHHAKSVTIENQHVDTSDQRCDSDNSEEYNFTTGVQTNHTTKPIFEVQIMNISVSIMADSNATVNTLSEQDFNRLKPKPRLAETKTRVYPYMSDKTLNRCGKFQANVTSML